MRNTITPPTTTNTRAGYISRRLVWATSSSCHFRVVARFSNTSVIVPLCSPALIRLTNTLSNAAGWLLMACDRVFPPSTSSRTAERISRKRGCSMLSRKSASPSSNGMPARESCSMWKQKVMRSCRVMLPRPSCIGSFTLRAVMRSSPMRCRRSSRSTSLTAASLPRTDTPFLSTELYW